MNRKVALAGVCALVISSSVLAQSNNADRSSGSQGSHFTLVVQQQVNAWRNWWQRRNPQRPPQHPRPVVRAVPELDGNMAFLALGLTVAVGALVREKRRKV